MEQLNVGEDEGGGGGGEVGEEDPVEGLLLPVVTSWLRPPASSLRPGDGP